MQINRLFEMVYILLNKRQVTAKEFAERFEVSTRTIYRDVECLCEAGVPIYTNKGKGGGIHLMENFVLNKSYLSEGEKQEILTALQGIKVAPYLSENETLGKLSALFGSEEEEWIAVDFGSWDHTEKEKFDAIKSAILQKKRIRFDYYNTKMERLSRTVEPLQLCFKEKTWYLKAYCTLRQQMRFFKLRRIKHLICLEETFKYSQIHKESQQGYERHRLDTQKVVLWIENTQAYRVFDEFEEEQVVVQEDGNFIVEIEYPIDEWLYGYLLSFGPYARVLEPEVLVEEMAYRIKEALKRYINTV
ncbi:MAG: YafY family transcriptional regulator [Cellulosilyticum sp.]|nr:YafY family transcriptional regulator [Cellulosilyticum sp.]